MIEVKLHNFLSGEDIAELSTVIARAYLASDEMQKIYGSNIAALIALFKMTIRIYCKHRDGRFYIIRKDQKIAGAFAFTVGDIAHNSFILEMKNGLLPFLLHAHVSTIRKILKNSSLQKKFQRKYYNKQTDIAGVFIAVAPEYQGQGFIAKMLFNKMNEDLRGKKNIYFETVSKDALKIYQRLGFSILESANSSGSIITAMRQVQLTQG